MVQQWLKAHLQGEVRFLKHSFGWSVLAALRELNGEQAPLPRSQPSGFGVNIRSPAHRSQLFSIHQHQSHVGRPDGQFGRSIHVTRAVSQETGTVAKEEGTKLEGKQYECIHATVVGDGAVGLVTLDRPKALNALSHALMVEVVDALQTFDTSPKVRVHNKCLVLLLKKINLVEFFRVSSFFKVRSIVV